MKIRFKFGQNRFGKLTVIESLTVNLYACICDCGNHVNRTGRQLQLKKFQSCDECRIEYVKDKIESKKQERTKCLQSIS